MQSQTFKNQAITTAPIGLCPEPGDTVPLTERQMAELQEAWLEHQVSPLREIQRRGVPYSALNE